MGEVDADNTAWLRTVRAERAWPAQRVMGTAPAEAAWLLAQHADADPDLHRRCLALLDPAVRAGEASSAYLAYLTDRVLRAGGEPQRFGTQFWTGPDGSAELDATPIKDIDQLDKRRAAVGLGPFAEYRRQMIDSRRDDCAAIAGSAHGRAGLRCSRTWVVDTSGAGCGCPSMGR